MVFMNTAGTSLQHPCKIISFSFTLSPFLSLSHSDPEQFRELDADITSYTIERLQPDESVIVGVAAMIDSQLGEVVTLSTRTNGYVGTVTGLQFIDIGSTRIRISWDPVSRATGYKITWQRDDGRQEIRSPGKL